MGAAGGACTASCCVPCCEQTGSKGAYFVKVSTVSTYSEEASAANPSTTEAICGDCGEDAKAYPHAHAEWASTWEANREASTVPPDLAVDVVEEMPALWDAKELATSHALGLPAGRGTTHEEGHRLETYEDGSVYEGMHARGLRHGRGVWRSDEESYEGQWADDHRHGFGRQMWRDGRVFVGQFSDGSFGGHGRMEWRSPGGELTVFEGQYVADLKHGHGRFQWPDGRVYDGEWRAGLRSGRATFTNAAGVSRKGLWKDDSLVRWLGPDE